MPTKLISSIIYSKERGRKHGIVSLAGRGLREPGVLVKGDLV
jgi:hypothetical protein